jgi:uncharacterized membrane protein YebE (DUF533 family)
VNDDSTKDQSAKFSQTVSCIGTILALGFLGYNLFEAYWTGEIFQREKASIGDGFPIKAHRINLTGWSLLM